MAFLSKTQKWPQPSPGCCGPIEGKVQEAVILCLLAWVVGQGALLMRTHLGIRAYSFLKQMLGRQPQRQHPGEAEVCSGKLPEWFDIFLLLSLWE